jgi:hypothetical protein
MLRVLDAAITTLGAAGWLAAGPLAATLLVGRSALFFPSLRWLAAAAVTWLVTGAATLWLAPRHPAPQGTMAPAFRGLMAIRSLSPLALFVPLAVLLYVDDASYHLVSSGAAPPARAIAAYLSMVALAGALVARLGYWLAGSQTSEAGALGSPASPAMSPVSSASRAATLATAGGVAAMLLINQGILGPLQREANPYWWLPQGTELLWGTAHAANVALSGLHLRLLLGSGSLTAAEPAPPLAPALALTCGALMVGTVVVARLLVFGVANRLPAALALVLVACLVLFPATPRFVAVLAALSLLPLLSPGYWQPLAVRARTVLAALAVLGVVLAGTSPLAFLRAAGQPLSAWPFLASVPTLGLVLLALTHALWLRASGRQPALVTLAPS